MYLPPSFHRSLLTLVPAAALAACAAGPPDEAGEHVGDTYQSFEDWKASLPRDPIDGAYLVDGDLGVVGDEALMRLFAFREKPGALVVNTRPDGGDDRWTDAEKMNLTYCVSPTFGDAFPAVVAAMDTAASDWAAAADVRFVHHGEADDGCAASSDGVIFEVIPAKGAFYNARSFLPSGAPTGSHVVFVDLENIARAAPKTLAGVLRHELGHVLGFRHEHIRPESNGACVENLTFRPLTPYDARSVMHYPAKSRCKGANEGDYLLTELDVEGARSLYGAP